MKVAGIAIVRNEEDVIELFVRHNIRFLDKLLIVNNKSVDNTTAILDLLREEGLPITVINSNHSAYEQHVITNAFCKLFLAEADYIIPLDADEIIYCESVEKFNSEVAKIPKTNVGLLKWKTFIPNSTQDKNYIKSFAYRRKYEEVEYGKVVAPTELLNHGQLSLGNHSIHTDTGDKVSGVDIDIALAHFPVRSSKQLVAKVLIGSHSFAMCKDRPRDQAYHWDELATYVRNNGYNLCTSKLIDIAISYCNKNQRVSNEVVLDSIPFVDDTFIKYESLQSTSLIKYFDSMLMELI